MPESTHALFMLKIILLALAYFATGWVGLNWAIETGFATPIWPPSGIALAAVLLFGYRMWPGVFLGSFLVNIISESSLGADMSVSIPDLLVALGISCGASLQAAGGAFLVRRYVNFPDPLITTRQIIKFFTYAGPVSCLINATISPTVLVLSGLIDLNTWLVSGITWWGGDTLGVLIFMPLILVWCLDPKEVWTHRRGPVTLALLAAFLVAISAFVYTRSLDREKTLLELKNRANDITTVLGLTLKGHLNVLASLEGAFHAMGTVAPEQFRKISDTALTEFPGLQAVSWNMRFQNEKRKNVEKIFKQHYGPRAGITERNGDGNLIPALIRPEYVPVFLIEPREQNIKALGYDVLSDPVRREALNRARDMGQPVATGRITLVQEKGAQYGFLVFRPHFQSGLPTNTIKQRRRAIRGYHTAVFRIGDMINSMFPSGALPGGLYIKLLDRSAPEGGRVLYTSPTDATASNGAEHASSNIKLAVDWSYDVQIPGRQWELHVGVLASHMNQHLQRSGWEVFVPGMIIAALIGVLTLISTGRQLELEASVEKRTKELRLEIAERKKIEKDVLAAKMEAEKANFAKSDFLASMSHDLRTPLNAIMGFSEMMDTRAFGPLGDSHYEEYAKDIHKSGKLLVSLIDDILDLSKVEAGKYELSESDVDIAELVQSSVSLISMLSEAGHIQLLAKIEPALPLLRADERALTQILNNLLSNAVKFTPENGKITVSAKLRSKGIIDLQVADTGIGMSSDDIAKALEPFEQASSTHAKRHEGTGLGLHLCQKLVGLHGGALEIESEPGIGTTVTLLFPPERMIRPSSE
jgi:two-component system, sensor histidine kinase